MTGRITTVGFDADDTLWQNEIFYRQTQERFASLLADYADPGAVARCLHEVDLRNLGRYGFGIKGFTLSMIETALEVSANRVPGEVIGQVVALGQDLLRHPVELLPGARAAVAALAASHRLLLISKGDLVDQERKLALSGLAGFFDGVEIVSDKTTRTYQRIFDGQGDGAARAVMVGNSLRSDVLPAIAAGAHGVHVPHAVTWAYEVADPPVDSPRFHVIATLAELPALIAEIG